MKILPTDIPDILVVEPQVFGDDRGFFCETYNQRVFAEKTGLSVAFVQDNHSRSAGGVLRGLHYQIQQSQGKLVRVVVGKVFDVAVDLRKSSPYFGRWVGCWLSAENHLQFWIPPGFAHGFWVVAEGTEVLYKTTEYYAPQHERCIIWNDPDLAIDWPLAGKSPILSAKDRAGQRFKSAEVFP